MNMAAVRFGGKGERDDGILHFPWKTCKKTKSKNTDGFAGGLQAL